MITSRIETITPEKAKEYLEHNVINRKISKERVRIYARDMRNGEWELNGESIKFNMTGQLVDGQHRLSAVVLSGAPVTMVVVGGVDEDVSLYDRGKSRTTGDTLAFIKGDMDEDIKNSFCARIARAHITIQTGERNPSDFKIIETMVKHEESLKFLSRFRYKSVGANIRHRIIMVATMYARESGVSEDVLSEFLETLRTGLSDLSAAESSSAITTRNDILTGRWRASGAIGSYAPCMRKMCYGIERAIYDYVNGIPRQKTYTTITKPTYSNNEIYKAEMEELKR